MQLSFVFRNGNLELDLAWALETAQFDLVASFANEFYRSSQRKRRVTPQGVERAYRQLTRRRDLAEAASLLAVRLGMAPEPSARAAPTQVDGP